MSGALAAHSFASALGWGAAYGFAWWILGGTFAWLRTGAQHGAPVGA